MTTDRMQLARSTLVHKTNATITSVARNASWSHGWLRGVVQYFFGAITVASFFLIVYMASNPSSPKNPESRCKPTGCRVVCRSAPYFDEYEMDIVFSVTETGSRCQQVLLTLESPMFYNHTLPEEWMSRLPSNIFELEIIGGNLQYIARQAFMSRFARYIRRLCFEHITLMEWNREILFGLVELEEIVIKDSDLVNINRNALNAVDNTLRTLSITGSGFFDPENLTGSSHLESLTNVIFSSNRFYNIIKRESFAKLKKCSVLNLNSCRIQSIGVGAFDYLENLNMLHLSNNYLKVLPQGLFKNILALTNPRPRINLQGNKWVCDCSNHEMRQLSDDGLLLIDPNCYYPSTSRGILFSQFFQACDNLNMERRVVSLSNNSVINIYNAFMYITSECGNNTSNSMVKFISPFQIPCPSEPRNGNITFPILKKPSKDKPRKNELLWTNFVMRGDDCSLLEVSTTESKGLGLVWYEDSCPNEVYCIATMPRYLRLYSKNDDVQFTFCPLNLSSGVINVSKCVYYSLLGLPEKLVHKIRIVVYVISGISCFFSGALLIYLIIRKFPNLLKGSSRILFVKHRNVEALILPPKLHPRMSLTSDNPANMNVKSNRVYVLSNSHVISTSFQRSKSTRSSYSSAPSYISALQPTEEQLLEWRLRHHFDHNPICDDDGLYSSLNETNTKIPIYDSLK